MVCIDDLDIYILRKIYFSKDYVTTWKIAKDYFKTDYRNINSKTNLIHVRLKKMEQWGIISIKTNGNSRKIYDLDINSCFFKKYRFPNGLKNVIMVKIKEFNDFKWHIFEI